MSGITQPGYAGQLFYGLAGATAGTQVLNCEDLNYTNPLDKIETTVRGAGVSVPKKSEKAVAVGAEITWSMIHKNGDAVLVSFLAASRTAALVALRTRSYSAGTGFDGDCTLTVTHEMTLKGQSKYNFTATPCDDLRDWEPNV